MVQTIGHFFYTTPMHRSAFTLVELLITLAIIAVVGAIAIPSYRNYQIRSDLHLAAEQAQQLIRRAQLVSQSGSQGSAWGYRADTGTLFIGTEYAARDAGFDEVIAVPSSITVSGLLEVHFTPVFGLPSTVGDIVFTALNGQQRIVKVRANTLSGPPVPSVQFTVHFDRIKNSGQGSATNTVHVGEAAALYEEGAWIPLTNNVLPIIDDGIVLAVNGLSVQRGNGFVRIVSYGGLESGGKEVIDATITFDRGFIDHIENEEGENEGEQPFDGNSNEGVGGDEYTLAADQKSVEFKTRVTNAGDTILIFWQAGTP